MDNIDIKYTLKFPEEYLGEVMGKLTVYDAVIHDVKNNEGISVLWVTLDINQDEKFSGWFQRLTNGKGFISRESNEPK